MAKPNAGKQVGEPCEMCGKPLVEGQFGAYCKPCFIEYKNKKEGLPPSEGGYAPKTSPRASYRPTNEAMATRREFQNTMDYKADNIAKAQAHKDASMTNLAICRDAVQLTIAEMAQGVWTEEMIQGKIKEWKDWLRLNVYETPF